MKKIPPGAHASNVLVGELDFLKKPVTAFVRLENACLLGDLTEVPVPTRFIFLMIGPPGTPGRYYEVGRAIATLMSDEVSVCNFMLVDHPVYRTQVSTQGLHVRVMLRTVISDSILLQAFYLILPFVMTWLHV